MEMKLDEKLSVQQMLITWQPAAISRCCRLSCCMNATMQKHENYVRFLIKCLSLSFF